MSNNQPKKRGRKPKKKLNDESEISENIVTKILVQNEENSKNAAEDTNTSEQLNINEKVKKKRGRKPKNALNNLKNQEEVEKKIPKKRGRNPKETIYSIKQIENIILKDESEDTVILHLAIHSDDIKDDNNVTSYDPQINIPEPY